ncbi:MAG: SCO family protein [Planctomycetota bacterium]
MTELTTIIINDPRAGLRRAARCALAALALVVLMPLASMLRSADAGTIDGPPPAERGIDQSRLGTQVPLDLHFVDEAGKTVQLSQYINGSRPLILNLLYFRCKLMCSPLLNSMTETLRDVKGKIGRDFDILTVSIDPSDTPDVAAGKKQTYLEYLHDTSAAPGWHFLTGEEPQIRKLATTVGWNYTPQMVDGTQEFAHGAALILLTPDGRVARFLNGTRFDANTLWLSLVEAGEGTVSTSVFEHLTLYCFHYDPTTGTYSAQAFRMMQVGGMLTVLVLGLVMGGFWLREWRRPDVATATTATTHTATPPDAASPANGDRTDEKVAGVTGATEEPQS